MGFNTLVYVVHPINEVENTTLVWADGQSFMTSYKMETNLLLCSLAIIELAVG